MKKYYTVGTVVNFQDEKKSLFKSTLESSEEHNTKKARCSKEHVIVHLAFKLTAKFCIKNQPFFFLHMVIPFILDWGYGFTYNGPTKGYFSSKYAESA